MEAARQCHRLALDCLELAEAARDPRARDQLIRLAELFARMDDRKSPRERQAA